MRLLIASLICLVGCEGSQHRDSLFTELDYTDSGYTTRTLGYFQSFVTEPGPKGCTMRNAQEASLCELSADKIVVPERDALCSGQLVSVEAHMDVAALESTGPDFVLGTNTTRPQPNEGAIRLQVGDKAPWQVSDSGKAAVFFFPLLDRLVEVQFVASMVGEDKPNKPTQQIAGAVYCKLPAAP